MAELSTLKPIWKWTPEEKFEEAFNYKESGIILFKENKNIDAFHKFSMACKILLTLEPIADLELRNTLQNEITNLRLILYSNMACCQYNQNNYEHVITLCNKILVQNKTNIKALYRRGLAYGKLKDFEKAIDDLKTALKLEPQNSVIRAKYNIYYVKWLESNKRANEMVKRMFKNQ
ncbi:uncharacterized protein Bdbt [Prorops nasuta]|uniref:uncharacterized protein Bdbt n=1 Tax=Prorops nasuta TaxID=863751 RepID=UPI0034CE5538